MRVEGEAVSKETKIVINDCYGGFSLSNEAAREYLRRTGRTWTEKPVRLGGRTFENMLIFEVVGEGHWSDRSLERTDPTLVAIVEEWGKRANGDCANLTVETVPVGTHYRIGEYDGSEWIETRDGIDWSIA
jgi:hypothetical protein